MSKRSWENQVEELLQNRDLTRRKFVSRTGSAGLIFGGALALSACGDTGGKSGGSTKTTASHPKEKIEDLNFTNWPLYIDEKTIPDFEKEYDAKVKYSDAISDNEEYFGKIREQLQRKQYSGSDILVFTDWMAARMIRLGYTEPIDKKNVPNAKNLQPNLQHPKYDKNRNFTLPWQSGMTAIGYNPKKTGKKLQSINEIFDPKYKGRVSMFTEARDSVGLVLWGMGVRPEEANLDQCLEAVDKIQAQNDKGQIRKFTGNDYTSDLTNGNLWISVAYSGDMIQLKADNPDLEFLIPDEGALLWTDNMLMPDPVEHAYAAETMMNFVYEPEIAAQIAAYVNYVTPVVGAKEVLEKTDPKTAGEQLIFPDQSTLDSLSPYYQLPPEEEAEVNKAFQKVTGA